jgi:tRNA A-37 threonylcarbamoyl transferase component Bud32
MKRSLAEILIKRKIRLDPRWKDHPGIRKFCRNIELRINDPAASVMKDDAAAKVAAVPFNERHLVIKQYNPKTWYKAAGRSVRKSKAKKTWENARYIRQSGIDTVAPVALIQDRIGCLTLRSFFVCEYVAGRDARSFFSDCSKNTDEFFKAAESVGDSLTACHARAIFLGDTKDTNIIVGTDRVCWVDLDAVTVSRLPWTAQKKKIRDWQVFFYNWRHNRPVRKLFLDVLRTRMDEKEFRRVMFALAVYAGRKFSARVSDRLTGICKEPAQIAAEAQSMADCGRVAPGWQKVQSSQNAIVARKQTSCGGIYCKVFLPRDWREGVKRLFRPGRGARAARSEHMMWAAGFNVPETLCWGQKDGKDYTVSREIEGVKMVSWLDRRDHPAGFRRMVLRRLGEEVGALHAAGFSHGDLRLSNILIREDTEKPVFYFLDNERTQLHRRRIPRREIVKNLRQINTDAVSRLSRTDRLRIFRAYHAACGTRYTNTQIRRLLAEVEKSTAQRLAAD